MMWQIDELNIGNKVDHMVDGSCKDCEPVQNGLPLIAHTCAVKLVG